MTEHLNSPSKIGNRETGILHMSRLRILTLIGNKCFEQEKFTRFAYRTLPAKCCKTIGDFRTKSGKDIRNNY